MTLQKGNTAPDFELPSTQGDTYRLSQHLNSGKGVLVAFYPFDWSPVCTNELGYFNANYQDFAQAEVTLAAISVDSPFCHAAWAKDQALKFPLLSDFNKDVTQAYGVLLDEYHGLKQFAKRAVFLVDASATIQYAWVGESPGVEPNYSEILDAVSAL